MKRKNIWLYILLVAVFWSFSGRMAHAQGTELNTFSYLKKEKLNGFSYNFYKEREELRGDNTRFFEKGYINSLKYTYTSRAWIFLPTNQQYRNFSLESKIFQKAGNLIDSSKVEEIVADQSLYGTGIKLLAEYSNRYYYTHNHYTLIQANGNAGIDLFRRTLEGTVTDAKKQTSDYSKTKNGYQMKANMQASAAWGYGRFEPVNHRMTAAYILNKFYSGRNFSEIEIQQLAQFIETLKRRRDPGTVWQPEKETEAVEGYLKSQFLLKAPKDLEKDWKYGEFLPRFTGSRVEFGPFFNYNNMEPDFIYGGYVMFENAGYVSDSRNRNFSADLRYSRYKKRDWVTLETNLGWSVYKNLRSQFDFGIKYIPGMVVNEFKDIQPLVHTIIPYLSYALQMDHYRRLNFSMLYRIVSSDQFTIPGPEIKLGFYSTKY